MTTTTIAPDGAVPAESSIALRDSAVNLALLQEVDVRLSIEVGSTALKIRDLLALNEGSVVELDRYATEMLDVLVNGTLLAKGEVVTVGDRLGVRVAEIVAPGDRVRSL
jgi:flagellar motor switch protein FliN/FliY